MAQTFSQEEIARMTDEEKYEHNIRTCPECGKSYPRNEMTFSRDCHGITMRLLCYPCWDKILEEKGYDGQYYTEADECIYGD